MKIAIRADASRAIGTGHVRRMLALAEALRDCGGDVRFVCRDLGLDVGTLVAEAGFALQLLPPPESTPDYGDAPPLYATWARIGQINDANQYIAALAHDPPVWAIVDHYSFDARWQDRVRGGLNCKIAAMDDLADRPLAVDLLINHNHADDHRAKYAGLVDADTPILGGPRFALLGPDYAHAELPTRGTKVRSVGIFMGGIDIDNATERALDSLEAIGFSGTIEIVTTSGNPHLAALKMRVDRRADITIGCDLPSLLPFFARHDLHIGGGGGATWERACLGAPTLGLILADNQREVLEPMAEHGCLALLDDRNGRAGAGLDAAIAGLIVDPAVRRSMAAKARDFVDGQGAIRVARAIGAPFSSLPKPPIAA